MNSSKPGTAPPQPHFQGGDYDDQSIMYRIADLLLEVLTELRRIREKLR